MGPERIDYDRLAADYARNRQVNPDVLLGLLTISEAGRASRVLEIGCGTGNYIVALQELTGAACWGADPSEGMLVEARRRPSRVKFERGTAERLPYKDDSFDFAFSVDVIHHVADQRAAFQEAYRVLRPRGVVCTVTDSEWIIRHRQPLSEYFPETVETELARYPRVSELRALMEATGFENLGAEMAEFPYLLHSAQPYRDKAFSSLHLIPPEAFERGLRRLESDLERGPIPCTSRYLLLWGAKSSSHAVDYRPPGC